MWAVADNIAFSAQHSGLQGNGIKRSASRRIIRIRFHHRPPGKRFILAWDFARIRQVVRMAHLGHSFFWCAEHGRQLGGASRLARRSAVRWVIARADTRVQKKVAETELSAAA
jgi:hypothetical protein